MTCSNNHDYSEYPVYDAPEPEVTVVPTVCQPVPPVCQPVPQPPVTSPPITLEPIADPFQPVPPVISASPVQKACQDVILGNRRNNVLVGDDCNNLMMGKRGKDVLTGNGGRDRFVLGSTNPFRRNRDAVDRITDFRVGQDTLVLNTRSFGKMSDRCNLFASVANKRQASLCDSRFTYVRSSGSLYYNANGSAGGFGKGGLIADFKDGLNLGSGSITFRSVNSQGVLG